MRGEGDKDAREEMGENDGDRRGAGSGERGGGAWAARRKRGAARSCGDPRAGWGAGRSARLYLNIRLCHTRGAADNFITSAYKNDCRLMQMACPSPPPASLCRRLRAQAREPPDVVDAPAARAPAPPDLGPTRPRGPEWTPIWEMKFG